MLACTIICFSFTRSEQEPSADEIISRMQQTINTIKTLKYTLKNTERVNGKLLSGSQKITFNASPRKCYVYMLSPREGAELIFAEGKNGNQTTYNPNGFPYFKIDLDPLGFLMRRNNHHTIYEIGFTPLSTIIDKIKNENHVIFKNLGTVNWNNQKCFRISIKMRTLKRLTTLWKKTKQFEALLRKKE